MKKFLETYRPLCMIFFPLLFAITSRQVIELAVNLVDNVMLGVYSETAMSGASLANQIYFMLQQLVIGLGAGVSITTAQFWGKGEIKPIRSVLSIGIRFALFFGGIFCVVTLVWPEELMRLFTNEPAVIIEGAKYLRISCWTYIPFSILSVVVCSLQGVQSALIGMVAALVAISCNICLNYVLIYGNFGAPELGVEGAAYATLISRIVEFAFVFLYLFFVDKKIRMKVRHFLSFDSSLLPNYIRVVIPMLISGALWGVAQAAQSAILGHISASVIAASAIASVVFEIFTVVGMSCANAASVSIGKTIGMGRLDLIRPYARFLQILFVVIGLVSGGLLFLLREPIVGLFVLSEETSTLTLQFLTILSVTAIGSCYEYPVESGIIAGGGETKFAAIVDNTFMWLFTIPVSLASAFFFGWSPVVTFCLLKADQILKCIPNVIKCNRYKWIKDVTKTE